MKRMKRTTRIIEVVYAAFALFVFVFCVIGDFSNPVRNNAPLKYVFLFIGLALCVYTLLLSIWKKERVGELTFLLLATAFTIGADTFLLMLQKHLLLGVILFFVAQNLHYVRFLWASQFERKVFFISLGYRLGLIVIGIIVSLILGYHDALSLWSIAYFACLVCNAIDALWAYVHLKKSYLLLLGIGFLFFIGCDVCVGLYNILPASESSMFYPWIWLFYIPAQALIISSGTFSHET